mgnify:CR=1 FL=1
MSEQRTKRLLVSSGSPYEPVIGFSRAVRAGRIVLDDSAPSARWRKLIVPGTYPAKRVKLPWES